MVPARSFRGVLRQGDREVLTFSDTMKGTKEGIEEEIGIDEARLDEVLDPEQKEQLLEEIELLDVPVSSLTRNWWMKENFLGMLWFCAYHFGVETFLKHFLK